MRERRIKKTYQETMSKASVVWVHVTAAAAAAAKSFQFCLTLCDPMDGSPPGSSVPGILQARVWEWVAISFSVHVTISS